MSSRVCPSCGAAEMQVFYEVDNVPVHSCLMLPSEEEALSFPTGDIRLGFCPACAFVSNTAFDGNLQEYDTTYEDQQSFSPTFNSFAGRLAKRLVEKYDVRDRDIVEIGCGKGDFLVLMCELGPNRGVGIDPTCIKERIDSEATDRITIIQDYYSEKYSEYTGDMVMCRHTLEHIHPTYDFVRTVREGIGQRLDTIVFFEIPDVEIVLRDRVFWDVYYEHCSYFSPGSLARLFRRSDFEVLDVYREYDDQYLLIDAKPVSAPSTHTHPLEEGVEALGELVQHFASTVGKRQAYWKDKIESLHAQGNRPVIWGSGSKCVAFITTLGLRDAVDVVVDINPHRHGKFIAGAGKQVRSPEYLREYDPGTILVMNPIYRGEITDMVRGMGLDAEVITF